MKARRWAGIILCLIAFACVVYVGFVFGGTLDTSDQTALGRALGFFSLLPVIVAVALAFLLKDVVVALLAGFICGVGLLVSVNGGDIGSSLVQVFNGACELILATISDRDKCAVLVLCLVIGGMVEVIRRSGGFEALARKLTRRVNTPRKANLIGELLGIIVFFDDYANSLIVGPVLMPLTDKLHMSRERLAYIVDTTAAPVTGIAVISSWVAVEVSVIDQGLQAAGVAISGYSLFIQSIPYCFYCIFCLIFMCTGSIMGREFGPMLSAEVRARRGDSLRPGSKVPMSTSSAKVWDSSKDARKIVVALAPIILLCVIALTSFYVDGRAAAIAAGTLAADAPVTLETIAVAFGSADTIFLVMEAAVAGSLIAILLGCAFGLFDYRAGLESWVGGASNMMMTVLILVLAWSLSTTIGSLGTVYYIVDLISMNVAWWLVPALIYAACCLISFAAGSYGCMFIVMPMAIPIAYAVMAQTAAANVMPFLLVCIASVIAGGIFGDHCSPLTDCTILSSLGAGCENLDHVKTQMPYALVVAGVSLVVGILPVTIGLPVWVSLLLGIGAMAGIIRGVGRKPELVAASTLAPAAVMATDSMAGATVAEKVVVGTIDNVVISVPVVEPVAMNTACGTDSVSAAASAASADAAAAHAAAADAADAAAAASRVAAAANATAAAVHAANAANAASATVHAANATAASTNATLDAMSAGAATVGAGAAVGIAPAPGIVAASALLP